MEQTDRIARLLAQQKRLAARIKREKKAAEAEQRERFYRLAVEAGILQIRDAVLREAFQKIAAENHEPEGQ